MSFLTETAEPKRMQISSLALEDLMLDTYLKKLFAPHMAGQRFDWTQYLTTSPEDLIYRRDVLRTLTDYPVLIRRMTDLTATLRQIALIKDERMLGAYGAEAFREFGVLQEAWSRMKAMQQALTDCDREKPLPAGLQNLSRVLEEKLQANFGRDFDTEWSKRTTGMEKIGSVAVEFRLNDEMQTTGAALTMLNMPKYVKPHLLSMNREKGMPEKPVEMNPLREMTTPTEEMLEAELTYNQKIFLQMLYRMTLDLDDLYQDLVFYLGALDVCTQMAARQVPLCIPAILPAGSKGFRTRYMMNPVLAALRPEKKPVGNDVSFDEGGEIFLLTGINQGGKTTFLRTVGSVQLLFQLGWPVPAREAAIAIVDKIVPVFSHEEDTALEHGKLGQELETMRDGMDQATPQSLLLCNEPITGTSPMENLYLSRLVLSSCKVNGFKGIWVTHLYDLASGADEMNRTLPGSKISSLVARAEKHGDSVEATYRIEPGEPAFKSYAREVMRKEAHL